MIVEVYSLPDCLNCETIENLLIEKGILYTLVYDIQAKTRAIEIGKCKKETIPCLFVPNQRKVALQKSRQPINTPYPLVFKDSIYIPNNSLQNDDFSSLDIYVHSLPEIIVYGRGSSCFNCYQTKQLLQSKNLKYTYIDTLLKPNADPKPRKCGKQIFTSFPKIIINGQCIGGYDELKQMNKTGKLDTLTLKTNIKSPISKSSTLANLITNNLAFTEPTIPQEPLQIVSDQTMGKMHDILHNAEDPYLKDMARFQSWRNFKTVLDLQPAPISELMTPDGKPFATLVIDAKCPPLLLEEMIRRGLPLDTRMTSYSLTTRDYILKTCPDITTRELLDRYQSHNNINYDTPAFNPAIEEDRFQTLKSLKKLEANLITSKSDVLIETLIYQGGEGIAQGFVSFFTAEITQYLEKRFSGNSLLRFWLPQITSAMIQSAVSLMLYPILKNTFWQDEEESQDSRKMLEALSVYFFSVLATGIAVNMAITKTKHFIEKKYGATARTSKVLNFILPYLATLANLPSLLLSQATYTNQAIAFGGFFVNLATRGTTFATLKWLREKCCPSSHSTPDDATEMQTLNQDSTYDNIIPLPDKPTTQISKPIRKLQSQPSRFFPKPVTKAGTSSTQSFRPSELVEAFAKRANKLNNINNNSHK
ncbi:hypothetical protein [Rickettsiella endosymbiont of Xylota segnis]|uniref:hypothetical protein n=1 Tax=Rickettsiella endosymbiont of Xylota segnis TaxID=3066238 RepID=UPI0030D22AF2